MKKLKKIVAATGTIATSLQLAATSVLAAPTIGTVQTPTKGYASNIGGMIGGLLTFVMVVAALAVLGFLIMGGIEWITAGGDKGKTESARNKITGAIIGLIIVAASFAILQLVLSFLGFSDLNDALSGLGTIQGP